MNLHIKNSYKIKDINSISVAVHEYYNNDKLDKNRTVESYIKEWFAHNWLYEHGLFVSHTKDVDLDGEESQFRLFVYNLIYYLFK